MQYSAELMPQALQRLRIRVHHSSSHLSFHSMIVSSVSMPFLMLRSYRCSNTAALTRLPEMLICAVLHNSLEQLSTTR